MSIGQYVIGGLALVTAVSIGYAKWTELGATAVKAEAKTAIVVAECATNTAETVNQAALDQIASLTTDIREAKEARAKAEKKSAERLRAYNDLQRKIANEAKDAPVSDSLERVLDWLRARDAAAGAGADGPAPSGADENHPGGTPPSGGPAVPEGPKAESPAEAVNGKHP